MEYCYNFLESMQAERVETAVPWVHHLSLALFHLFGEEEKGPAHPQYSCVYILAAEQERATAFN